MQYTPQKKGNLFTGLIGAVIGAAIGAAVWVLIARGGYILSIVGLLIAYLASKGYDICKGPQTNAKVVILILCVILAVVGGNYAAISWQIHDEYVSYFGSTGGYGLISEADFRNTVMNQPEVSDAMASDTATGLVFAGIGCAGIIAANYKSRKKRAAEEAARAQAEYEQSMYAAGYADPNAVYADPNAGYADPNAAYVDPNAAYEDTYAAPAADPRGTYPAAGGYSAPAAPAYSRSDADSESGATYKFTSMRTAAPAARPAAPAAPASVRPAAAPTPAAAPAGKKNPFVKPEFSNSFNAGKSQQSQPAKQDNSGSQTFYSDNT